MPQSTPHLCGGVPGSEGGETMNNFFLPENLIIPNFQWKQGDKVIRMREEKRKKEREDFPSKRDKLLW
jgi:hypothetical protein